MSRRSFDPVLAELVIGNFHLFIALAVFTVLKINVKHRFAQIQSFSANISCRSYFEIIVIDFLLDLILVVLFGSLECILDRAQMSPCGHAGARHGIICGTFVVVQLLFHIVGTFESLHEFQNIVTFRVTAVNHGFDDIGVSYFAV